MMKRAIRILFFTNDLCPFAHRATFAYALRPPPPDVAVDFLHIPYTRQIEFAEKLGLESGLVGASGICLKKDHYASLSVADLRAAKDNFVANINPTGEVPALVLQDGEGQHHVLVESDVCAEYFELAAARDTDSLIPACPLTASRMRLAIKRFSGVTGPMYKLLSNQDATCDKELTTQLQKVLENFASVLDEEGGFCVGGQCSLADVISGPVLYRMGLGLRRWREFDLGAECPRLEALVQTVAAMPEFQRGLVPDAAIVGNYEYAAHGGKWNEEGTSLVGRGASGGSSRL